MDVLYNSLCCFFVCCPNIIHHCTMYQQLGWFLNLKCIHLNFPSYLKQYFVHNLCHTNHIYVHVPRFDRNLGKNSFLRLSSQRMESFSHFCSFFYTHPSIFLTDYISFGIMGLLELVLVTVGQRQGMPWRGRKFVPGLLLHLTLFRRAPFKHLQFTCFCFHDPK